jgi:hypothetical protein
VQLIKDSNWFVDGKTFYHLKSTKKIDTNITVS